MRGVQLIEQGVTAVNEVEVPDAAGKALIRMQTVGLCGTDASIVAGKIAAPIPQIMGHEGVGVVEEAGPLGYLPSGQRVLIDPAIACDVCDLCRRGLPNLCRNGGLMGRDFDGLFADYAAVPETQLLAVPEEMTADQAGLLQVLGTCVHASNQVPVVPGDTAVVMGLGVAGQLIAQLLTLAGAKVVGVTRSEWKRDLATQLGAAHTASPDEAMSKVADLTAGRGADVVVEAAGYEQTLSQAIELAGHHATVAMFGTFPNGGSGLPYYQMYFKELTIRAPRAATKSDYERSIALVADGAITVEPLVSHTFELDEAPAAFATVKDSSSLKVLMNAR